MTLLVVMIAGSLGGPARFALEHVIAHRAGRAFPWGTLTVNVTGSFVLGALAGTTLHGLPGAAVTTGFLGAYTTFSSYAYEAVALAQRRSSRRAALYLAATVVLATAAAWLGLAITS